MTVGADLDVRLGGLAARVRTGAGARVLWLHGYAMDTGVWDGPWDALPDWYHVAVDLPGHGDTDADDGDALDVAGASRAVVEVMDHFELRDVVAVSYGSVVALAAAMERPELFRSLVVCAPGLAGGPLDDAMADTYRALRRGAASGSSVAELASTWLQAPVFAVVRHRPAAWAAVRAAAARHSWRELRRATPTELVDQSSPTAGLERLTMPLLVVVGGQDLPATRRTAALLAEHASRSEVVDLPDSGHLAVLEDPDVVAPHIAAHLLRAITR